MMAKTVAYGIFSSARPPRRDVKAFDLQASQLKMEFSLIRTFMS